MNEKRRLLLLSALSGVAGAACLAFAPAIAGAALPLQSSTDALRALAAAPESGRPIVLARAFGQPADLHTAAASLLAAQGFHVLQAPLRDASAGLLGQDLLGFIDAQHIPEAVFVGIGPGARAVQTAAQLRRSRVIGMVLAQPAGDDAKDARNVPTITLPADASAQHIADAAAKLARQGQWRT